MACLRNCWLYWAVWNIVCLNIIRFQSLFSVAIFWKNGDSTLARPGYFDQFSFALFTCGYKKQIRLLYRLVRSGLNTSPNCYIFSFDSSKRILEKYHTGIRFKTFLIPAWQPNYTKSCLYKHKHYIPYWIRRIFISDRFSTSLERFHWCHVIPLMVICPAPRYRPLRLERAQALYHHAPWKDSAQLPEYISLSLSWVENGRLLL